jgi:hypothetical protein
MRELQNALQPYLTIGNLDFLTRHQPNEEQANNHPQDAQIALDSASFDFRQKLASYEKTLLVRSTEQIQLEP